MAQPGIKPVNSNLEEADTLTTSPPHIVCRLQLHGLGRLLTLRYINCQLNFRTYLITIINLASKHSIVNSLPCTIA